MTAFLNRPATSDNAPYVVFRMPESRCFSTFFLPLAHQCLADKRSSRSPSPRRKRAAVDEGRLSSREAVPGWLLGLLWCPRITPGRSQIGAAGSSVQLLTPG